MFKITGKPKHISIGSLYDFSFSEYPHYVKKINGKASCASVWVHNHDEKITVTIEDGGYRGDYPLPRNFHVVATCVYYQLLHKISEDRVTWIYCNICDKNGDETHSEVRMHWNGKVFSDPFFGEPKVITNYRVFGLEFQGDGLLFKFDPGTHRKDTLIPWKRLPGLARASESDRRAFTMHRNHSVIYWYKLERRLIVRDCVANQGRSVRKPQSVSRHDFIYRPHPSFRLLFSKRQRLYMKRTPM